MSSEPGSDDLTRKQRREQAREQRRAAEEAERARTARRRRLTQLAGALAAAAAVVVVLIVVSSGGGKSAAKVPANGQAVASSSAAFLQGVPQSGLTLGSPKAPVTMVEFADLQCPFCQQFALNVLPTLVNNYVRSGRLQIVFRNLAFIGPDSKTAAQMAAAAGQQNRLWSFISVFYANQQPENTSYVTDGFLRSIAAGVPGLNGNQALSTRFSAAVTAQLGQADKLAQQNLPQISTPAFLLGKTGAKPGVYDYTAKGGLTPAAFTPAIDRLLKP